MRKTFTITGNEKQINDIEQLLRTLSRPRGYVVEETQQQNLSDITFLTYDHQDLIQKANELFQGTAAEIPQGTGEVKNAHFLKRTAIITASHLLQYPYKPIRLLQSVQLLQQGKLPNPQNYWEDLALILYDLSLNGKNQQEANYLFQQLQSHNLPTELPLLIVNSGLEKDEQFSHKVKPVIIPGLTQAIHHETLKRTGDHNFEYGLEQGLPSINDTLYMPLQSNDLGLRLLCRGRDLDLYAGDEDLVYSGEDGWVTLARTIF